MYDNRLHQKRQITYRCSRFFEVLQKHMKTQRPYGPAKMQKEEKDHGKSFNEQSSSA